MHLSAPSLDFALDVSLTVPLGLTRRPDLQVDLFRECPFWQEDGSCMNRACSVETTEEVSGDWRASSRCCFVADPLIDRRSTFRKLGDQKRLASSSQPTRCL